MRTIRTVTGGLAATLVGLAAVVAGPTTAVNAASKPERVIAEVPPAGHQVAYNAFRLKGTVSNPQVDGTMLPFQGKVLLTKKACKGCKFRTVRKVKVNDKGVFKARLTVPDRGRWTWRVKVKGNTTYKTTTGEKWTLFFD
jgi:hypothetical protein